MRQGKKFSVLFLGDYGQDVPTGFATVSNNIMAELRKIYGERMLSVCISINNHRDNYWENDTTYVMSAVKNAPIDFTPSKEFENKGIDQFGRIPFLLTLMNGIKLNGETVFFDLVFIIQDLGVVLPMVQLMRKIKSEKAKNNQKSFKTMYYYPVDCDCLPYGDLLKELDFFDTVVAYTQFTKNVTCGYLPHMRKRIKILPHGTNFADFYPYPQEARLDFRKQYFGDNADKFIITVVARNQQRKDIPTTIFGFIELLALIEQQPDKATLPKPFLYLHTHPKDPMGHDLYLVMSQLKIKEGVHYKFMDDIVNNAAPIEKVNAIFNASDVILSTNKGEGWGLSASQAMATKTILITSNNTANSEIGAEGRAFFLVEQIPTIHESDNIIRYQCDYLEVADVLLDVMRKQRDKSPELEAMKEKAFKWVSALSWANISVKWADYIDELLKM